LPVSLAFSKIALLSHSFFDKLPGFDEYCLFGNGFRVNLYIFTSITPANAKYALSFRRRACARGTQPTAGERTTRAEHSCTSFANLQYSIG
jgi:hypothetical protein